MSTINPPEIAEMEAVAVLTLGPPEQPAASPLDRPHRMTTERYCRMVEAGVYQARDPVYLWKGRLVEKMVKGRPHVIASTSLMHALFRLVPAGWHVEQEQPVDVGDDSMPEPDIMVVRGHINDYKRRAPTARDVVMIVEVADSSLAQDLGDVLETYASQSIPIYWVVNIPALRIEVYTEPVAQAERPYYRTLRRYHPDDEVPVVIDGREVGRVAARDVLP